MKAVLLALASVALSAGPIQVGPIALTGSGSWFWPDQDFGWGLTLDVSGSNSDGDYVSITGMATQIPTNNGSGWDAPVNSCAMGLGLSPKTCQVSINGVTGLGAFFNLGGGSGLVRVYGQSPFTMGMYGPILAEAQIISYREILDYPSGLASGSRGYFNIWGTPQVQVQALSVAVAPEPSMLIPMAGLAFMCGLMAMARRYWLVCAEIHKMHLETYMVGRGQAMQPGRVG